jgi:hypothetical protein
MAITYNGNKVYKIPNAVYRAVPMAVTPLAEDT